MVIDTGHFVPGKICKVRIVLLPIHSDNIVVLQHIGNLLGCSKFDPHQFDHLEQCRAIYASVIDQRTLNAEVSEEVL